MWREVEAEAKEALEAIVALYDQVADALPHYNESQTEEHWIRPVLDILGHVYEVHPALTDAPGTPDYAFFADEGARREAALTLGEAGYWQTVLAVGDAKRWDRPLDKRIVDGAPDAFTNANPCYQIDYYLRRTGCAWGVVSNGRRWRLFHRDSSFRLDVFYEVDLVQLILQGDADRRRSVDAFRYFYLFFRAAAFHPDTEEPALRRTFRPKPKGRCWLDEVLAQSAAYAVRVGDELKGRVYEALKLLAQGFLDYPTPSPTLPRVTGEGAASPPPAGGIKGGRDLPRIHDACLILLYRLLFLLYAESRGLLPLDNASYAGQYSLKAIKEGIAHKLDAGVTYLAQKATLWNDLRALFDIIYSGQEMMGVPAYDGRLFDPARYPFLEERTIGDKYLAQTIDLLARAEAEPGQGLSFVDYRDLSIRHLGSIYEGLLEYRLAYAAEEMAVVRRDKKEEIVKTSEVSQTSEVSKVIERIPAGQVYPITDRGERKATGSYYTPDYIVKYIVEQTLGPLADAQAEVLEGEIAALQARNTSGARRTRAYKDELARLQNSFADRVLALNVLDPAMGSGHFLVEATDYLARRIVESGAVTEADDEESELSYWRRRVVERCIYGVDLNPLAVELAKLSLWLKTVAKGKPLSFLDHHLRCGNSLIGARVADLQALPVRKKRRKKEAEARQLAMWDESAFTQDMFRVVGAMRQIGEYETADLVSVREKERLFEETVERERRKWRTIADLWTATYFGLELTPELYNACVQYAEGKPVLLGAAQAEAVLAQAHAVWEEKRFFHWEIEFPEMFFDEFGRHQGDAAGFDAVVGNPPYLSIARLETDEKSYLRAAYPDIFAGNSDILYYFIGHGVQVNREGGVLGLIVARYFIEARFADGLRRYILANSKLAELVDFGNYQVFPGANVLTNLLFCEKTRRAGNYEVSVRRLTRSDTSEESVARALFEGSPNIFTLSRVDSAWLSSDPWHFVDDLTRGIKTTMLSVSWGLGEKCEIVQAMQTGMNAVFVVDEQTIGQHNLERSLLRKLAKTGNVRRYHIEDLGRYVLWSEVEDISQFPNTERYLKQFQAELVNRYDIKARNAAWWRISTPRNAELFESDLNRILTPFMSTSNKFYLDTEKHFNDGGDLRAIFPREGIEISLCYVLVLLNSRAGEFFHQSTAKLKRGGYYEYYGNALEQFPIRRISFTTPPEERERLVERGLECYEAYLEHGEDVLVRAFVAARLDEEPEQADVVHDLLAHLAERMIEMHKAKQAEVRRLLEWLADYTGLPVDDWALRTSLRSYYEHGWAEMQRVLRRNQRKLPKVDLDMDAYKNEPAAKIRTAWETSMETLQPLLACIEATDRLIDRIVYQLYGLTEEEIAVVEGTLPDT